MSALATLALALPLAGANGTPGAAEEPAGYLLRAAKVLTAAEEGPQVVDRGAVLVSGGRIEAVGPAAELVAPEGYRVLDVGDRWIMPGMIDLHCHVAGHFFPPPDDITDPVYLANPGLRASTAVTPYNELLRTAVATGVTTVLYIPGSATNMNGWGVLLKTGHEHYEDMLVRDPGSLKVAQSGNPERYGFGPGRSFQNWHTRKTVKKGLAYARRHREAERSGATPPPVDPTWENFRDLEAHEIAISVHTQIYQVVLTTLTMFGIELDVEVFLDHSTIGGWRAGGLAAELGVPAIVGPRQIDTVSQPFLSRIGHPGQDRFEGVAAGYQRAGHTEVGFNTDSPVLPQHELFLQAAMGARYGFDDSEMGVIRGLTIVPARAAKIADRVGSLEVGKEADLVVLTGHPADPRTVVDLVLQDGEIVYDPAAEGRRW